MFNKTPSQVISKADPQDPQQIAAVVDHLKKWARGKLKKGTLREVAGRGGKVGLQPSSQALKEADQKRLITD